MKDTIKALFSGEIYPFENCNIKSEQFLKIKKSLSEKRQELIKTIDNDKLEEYDNLLAKKYPFEYALRSDVTALFGT